MGYVWNILILVSDIVTGFLSVRTTYLMNMFKYYRTNLVIRLVAKPPLFQSQRFWVSFTPNPASIVANRLGFDWNPSEENEVFILIPWTSTEHMLPIAGASLADFGEISVSEVSNLVTEEGLPAPLDISMYVCPCNMELFVPLPIIENLSPSLAKLISPIQTFAADESHTLLASHKISVNLGSITGGVGQVTLDNNLFIVTGATSASTVVTDLEANTNYTLHSVNGLDLTIQGFSLEPLATLTWDVSEAQEEMDTDQNDGRIQSWMAYSSSYENNPHAYRDEASFTGWSLDSYNLDRGDLVLNSEIYNEFRTSPNDHHLLPRLMAFRMYFNSEHMSYNKFVLPILGSKFIVRLKGFVRTQNVILSAPLISHFRDDENNDHSVYRCGRGALYVGYIDTGSEIRYIEPSTIDMLSPRDHDLMKSMLLPIDVSQAKLSLEGTEQMFEYTYNELSKQHVADYGKMTDHSLREDKHWQHLGTTYIASGDSSTSFSWSPVLSTATKELFRHMLVANTPLFKLTSTSNPSTNVMLRITELTDTDASSDAQILQLPGQEWDIKSGPLIFKPYWVEPTAGVFAEDLKFDFQISRIAGTIGTSFSIEWWLNTSTLEYHHMQDPDLKSVVVFDADGFTQCCGATKCICNRLKSKKYLGYNLEISESETVPEVLPVAEALSGVADVNQTTPATSDPGAADAGMVNSEARWNFTASITVDPVLTSMVRIPINNLIFGKYAATNASRYYKWKGTPRVKLMTTAASTTNAHIFVVHDNVTINQGATFLVKDFIRMFPTAIKTVNDDAIELDLMWRRLAPVAPIRGGGSADPDLGFLDICIPEFTQPLISGAINLIQISIYCDVSDVQFEHPIGYSSDATWTGINITEFTRS
jgi:hypothetical protein